jgi:hypothetical protein
MDAFKSAAERALDRGSKETARRILTERKICFKLVDVLLAAGCSITHHNGEYAEVKRSTDKAAIRAAFFATDMEKLAAFNADGSQVGWWSLVYGNDGWDVISDYSANSFAEAIWKDHLEPLADGLELGTIRL